MCDKTKQKIHEEMERRKDWQTQDDFVAKWTKLLEKASVWSKNLEDERKQEGWNGNHFQNMALYLWKNK